MMKLIICLAVVSSCLAAPTPNSADADLVTSLGKDTIVGSARADTPLRTTVYIIKDEEVPEYLRPLVNQLPWDQILVPPTTEAPTTPPTSDTPTTETPTTVTPPIEATEPTVSTVPTPESPSTTTPIPTTTTQLPTTPSTTQTPQEPTTTEVITTTTSTTTTRTPTALSSDSPILQ